MHTKSLKCNHSGFSIKRRMASRSLHFQLFSFTTEISENGQFPTKKTQNEKLDLNPKYGRINNRMCFLCYDCEKIVRRCPDCCYPVFSVAQSNDFVRGNGEPLYKVWMDLDGSRFQLKGNYTEQEVKTHFKIDPEST